MARKPYISKLLGAALGGGYARRRELDSTYSSDDVIALSQLLSQHEALPKVYAVLNEVRHRGPGRYELKLDVGKLMSDAWHLCQQWQLEAQPEACFSAYYKYEIRHTYYRMYEQTLFLSMVLALLKMTGDGSGHTQLLEDNILSIVSGDMAYYPRFRLLYEQQPAANRQQLLVDELQKALAERDQRIEQLQRDLADARNRADQEENALSTQTLLRYLDVMPKGEKVVLLRALSYMEAVAKGEDAAAMMVLREAIEADVRAQISAANPQAAPQLPAALSTPEAMRIWQRLQQLSFVDEQYQRLPTTTRSQSCLIAELFAEHCGISAKWATFERLWDINNLAQEKQNMLNTGLEPQRAAEIYGVFE